MQPLSSKTQEANSISVTANRGHSQQQISFSKGTHSIKEQPTATNFQNSNIIYHDLSTQLQPFTVSIENIDRASQAIRNFQLLST